MKIKREMVIMFGRGQSATLSVAQEQAHEHMERADVLTSWDLILESVREMALDPFDPRPWLEDLRGPTEAIATGSDKLKLTLDSGAVLAATVDGSIVMRPADNDPNREVAIPVCQMFKDGSLEDESVKGQIKSWIENQFEA